MAKPVIGYLSMLRLTTTTITPPGTATGYSINDIADLKSYKGWLSSTAVVPIQIDIDTGAGGATADYIAIVNSNLSTLACTVRVLSGAASPAATERLAATSVTDNNVWYQGFTVAAAQRYWRITITAAGSPVASAPWVGEIFLGMKSSLPEYLAPTIDPFFRNVEVAGSRSEGGHYLGAILRGQTHRGRLEFGEAGAARAAFTSDLNAFLNNHAFQRKPFVFVLDTDDADFAVARYLKMTDDGGAGRFAVGGSWGRLTFGLDVEEAMMETA